MRTNDFFAHSLLQLNTAFYPLEAKFSLHFKNYFPWLVNIITSNSFRGVVLNVKARLSIPFTEIKGGS